MMKIFKNSFFWGGILSISLIIWFVSVTVWKTMIPTTPQSPEHEVWLHSITLSKESVQTGWWLKIFTGGKKLDILDWLTVWNGNIVPMWGVSLSVIGWGRGNSLNVSNAGIGWWWSNKVTAKRWAIGWWWSNAVSRVYWVVIWWTGNTVKWDLWVIVWWQLNSVGGDKGVILWGYNNYWWSNSLVMWHDATWGNNSFAWNGVAQDSGARIDADNWVLIWTKMSITGVKLVVSGAVKLRNYGNKYDVNNDWKVDRKDVQVLEDVLSVCPIPPAPCPYDVRYDFDGDWKISIDELTDQINNITRYYIEEVGKWWIVLRNWHIMINDSYGFRILGRTGSSLWDDTCGCLFGWVMVEAGDMVKVYSDSYSTNCESIAYVAKCMPNWQLDIVGYPYCYEISSDPRWTGEKMGWWFKTGAVARPWDLEDFLVNNGFRR